MESASTKQIQKDEGSMNSLKSENLFFMEFVVEI